MRVWRSVVCGILVVVLATVPSARVGAGPGEVLLSVDDGEFLYDTNGDCQGDTDDHQASDALALRHWHGGLPFVHGPFEVLGGFGCRGGPAAWQVTVPAGATATLEGRLRYTWDQQVAGGCLNDVHLHVRDGEGALVYTTLSAGPAPVVPGVLQVREHRVEATLIEGVYVIEEDVFSGAHTAWLTRLSLTVS